jgi:hypothetical protein
MYLIQNQLSNGGFEELYLPSPYEGEENKPMPCGWKVNGELFLNESTVP